MNNKHQNTNKTIKTITPRTEKSRIEIQKHFEINKRKSSEVNQGIDSFPIVGEIEEFKEPDKINFEKSRFLKSSSSLIQSSSRDFDINSTSDCTSLNRKVEEINKQLADLEKDIQTNFYDPKTSIGSFVHQNPTNTPLSLSQFTLNSKINTNVVQKYKPPSIQLEIGITKSSKPKVRSEIESKTPKSESKNDPSVELKSEIMQYRQTIKNKLLDEKMERKLEELNKQNERMQQENQEFQLPSNLSDSIRKIQEFQKTSERLNPSMEDIGVQSSSKFNQQINYSLPPKLPLQIPSSSKNEDASKTVPSKPTTISAGISTLDNKDIDIVDKLLENTEAELKNLKTDVNQYFHILQTENTGRSISPKSPHKNEKCSKPEDKSTPEVDEFFKILRTHIPDKPDPSKSKKQKENFPKDKLTPRSRSSTPRTPGTSRSEDKKPIVPKRKEPAPVSQRKSFEVPEKKNIPQNKIVKKDKPFTPLQDITEEDKSISTSREISPKKPSTCDHLCTRYEENKMAQTDFDFTLEDIQIPPNTPNSSLGKSEMIESPEKPEIIPEKTNMECSKDPEINCKDICEIVEVIESFYSGKKKLSVQTLPAVDIRRPLVTQKMPDVIIQPSYIATDQENTIQQDNVKYLEFTHKDVNKEIPKTADNTVEITPINHEIINNIIPEEHINKIDKTLDDNKEKNVTIREELNINLDDIPSVQTLKEIQNYLEQRCSLIRKRLDEERDLKPGEFISLRWKLNQPPRWQTTTTVTETENTTDTTLVPKMIVPTKKYDPLINIKPKAILKKISSEQIITHPNNYLFDKATQYSFDSSSSKLEQNKQTEADKIVEIPKQKKNNLATLPPRIVQLNTVTNQLSIPGTTESNVETEVQTSDFQPKIKEVKESATQYSPDVLSSVTESVEEIEIQAVNIVPTVKDSATQSSPEKKTEKQKLIEQSKTQTVNLLPTIKKVKECSTQYCVDKKCEKFKTKTQITNLPPTVIEVKETGTQSSPKKIEKHESSKAVTFKETATQKDGSPKKIMKTVSSGVTENELKPTESEDKCISCNLNEINDYNDMQERRNRQQQILASSVDSFALYNPARKVNLDRYRTSRSRSPERSDTKTNFKCDSSSESSSLKINKFKCKRLQQKYRKNSTPIPSSSTYTTTENNSDDISLSEGELRLPCECSTSIGEIHLCHYANNIRKKVRTLKQNPDKIVKDSFDTKDLNISYKYKYYDNWVTYYVTKSDRTVSSGEIGTHSNLSSITSISPSD